MKNEPVTNSIGMKLQLLPAGTFVMGSGSVEAFGVEKPAHQVTLTKPFYIGVYEVTQEQYEKVMGNNLSKFKGPQRPEERVSWEDAVAFCKKLSELPEEKAAGRTYCLPTEAEWEYACRAGTTTTFSVGDDDSELGDHAWFGGNSNGSAHPVGQKKPNAWGLHDMHGNVFEWCHDWYGDYPSDSVSDPSGPSSGSHRVYRGGSWFNTAGYCRSSYRSRYIPTVRDYLLGFRLASVPSSE